MFLMHFSLCAHEYFRSRTMFFACTNAHSIQWLIGLVKSAVDKHWINWKYASLAIVWGPLRFETSFTQLFHTVRLFSKGCINAPINKCISFWNKPLANRFRTFKHKKNGFDHLSHCFLCVYNSFRSIWLHSLNWYFWFLLHSHCTFSFVLCNFYKQRHLLTDIYNSRYHRNPLQSGLYPYDP